MGQKKLQRFAEIATFPNVLEYPSGMKGKWHDFFGNANAITLELACGKGEYTLGLGRLFPGRNCIGVDLKGNRIWRGAKTALDEQLHNVAFLRTEIERITDYFAGNEVSEIWITFPDPQLRLSKMKKRLTHPRFLRLYSQLLQPGGLVHLKTDSPDLYRFTKTVVNLYGLQLLKDTSDLYSEPWLDETLLIRTHYEQLDIANSSRIHYLCFTINTTLPGEKDPVLKQLCREQEPG